MSTQRTRDPAYMARKQREYRARKKALLRDYRTRLHNQAMRLTLCPCPNCTKAA